MNTPNRHLRLQCIYFYTASEKALKRNLHNDSIERKKKYFTALNSRTNKEWRWSASNVYAHKITTFDFMNKNSIAFVSIRNDYLFIIDTECNCDARRCCWVKIAVTTINGWRWTFVWCKNWCDRPFFLKLLLVFECRKVRPVLHKLWFVSDPYWHCVVQKVAASLKYIVECPSIRSHIVFYAFVFFMISIHAGNKNLVHRSIDQPSTSLFFVLFFTLSSLAFSCIDLLYHNIIRSGVFLVRFFEKIPSKYLLLDSKEVIFNFQKEHKVKEKK